MSRVLLLLLLSSMQCGGADDEALRHLLLGNEFAGQGKHIEAVEAWRAAAVLRPDSNVPNNNIANSYLSLERVDDALDEAKEAFRRKIDYMTSVTLSNVYKKKKDYRNAEDVLLQGTASTMASPHSHEHPFWSLASLYWDQGDYIEFLKYAHLGLEYKSKMSCAPAAEPPCALPAFELEILDNIFNASADLSSYIASQHDFEQAVGVLKQALRVARVYGRHDVVHSAECKLDCLQTLMQNGKNISSRSSTQNTSECAPLHNCAAMGAQGRHSRYARMAAVRIMGCDWRHRRADQKWVEDRIERGKQVFQGDAHMHPHTPTSTHARTTTPATRDHDDNDEFLFECQGGLVCGAGAQAPLHLWAINLSLPAVRTMGQLQAQQLQQAMRQHGAVPRPIRAHQRLWDQWGISSAVGTSVMHAPPRLHVAFISSDLLRDHPVGNIMSHILPLHDLSRMQITLYIVHEHQQHFASQAENKHVLGDVRIVMLGRGPHVSSLYHPQESEEAAELVNSAGVCILVDLVGYTSDHRQDVLALRPAPLQMSYHGYMGTSGADYIDYYLADKVIAPPEHASFFSEKLVYMPECFLGPSHRAAHQLWGWSGGSRNDFDGRGEDDISIRRVANGLPPSGTVLCNFNQHFKIDPHTFALWQAAVKAVNGTLWMLRGTAVSERNLERQFYGSTRGAGGKRRGGSLLWAERAPLKDHLRRAALCDVALDTFDYNMGATGADTLYAAVPVAHVPSNKAVGRMMTAMLTALRMPELITRNADELLILFSVLTGPNGTDKLLALRTKLLRRIVWTPLFDVRAWVNDFDQSLRLMWDQYLDELGSQTSNKQVSNKALHILTSRPRAIF